MSSASKSQSAGSPLQTVDRALAVLLSFTARRSEWGVTELAEEFGFDKSSAQRLLAALAARGFLSVDEITHRYRLGPAVWRIASSWERRGGMAMLVNPLLAELADATMRTAVFTLADGAYLRCVAAVDGGHVSMRDHPLVGEVYPAHAGATSRAYFAFLPKGQRESLIYRGPLARFSKLTELDPVAIEAEMAKTSEAGWAYSEGEYDVNTRAVAAPVMVGAQPIGSVSVGERKNDPVDDILDHVEAVQETAKKIGMLLSHPTHRKPSGT
ncbi:MAG TPA: IclR family transcriptional regulator [Microbacterium sp.]|uniref:IclR family transcriptional regulator n=1 Tax=Microbacterium arabinogalactanolyticum TaxID=69365 RepID=UPI002C8C7A3F|nr:IclR family transcriptional regulator [Microbacterium sp.]